MNNPAPRPNVPAMEGGKGRGGQPLVGMARVDKGVA